MLVRTIIDQSRLHFPFTVNFVRYDHLNSANLDSSEARWLAELVLEPDSAAVRLAAAADTAAAALAAPQLLQMSARSLCILQQCYPTTLRSDKSNNHHQTRQTNECSHFALCTRGSVYAHTRFQEHLLLFRAHGCCSQSCVACCAACCCRYPYANLFSWQFQKFHVQIMRSNSTIIF